MSTASPKIFIATPTTNGIMLSDTVSSTIHMITHLHAQGIATEYHTTDGYNLTLQRDWLAHAFLESACTHLLWIDSDMAFEPALCDKLLAAAKPLIGTIYTKRALDLAKLKNLVPAHGFDHALALAYDWNVRFLGPELTVQKGLCRVEGIGFGFTLIERSCFLAQAEETPVYQSPLNGARVRSFFREQPADNGAMLDLDYSFCKRWVARGGDVWAYAGAQIRHVGDFRYGVPFSAYLKARETAPPRTDTGQAPPSLSDSTPSAPEASMPDGRNGTRS